MPGDISPPTALTPAQLYRVADLSTPGLYDDDGFATGCRVDRLGGAKDALRHGDERSRL